MFQFHILINLQFYIITSARQTNVSHGENQYIVTTKMCIHF